MISTNSSQVLSVKTDRMKLLGIALIQISDGHSNLLFQKGIGISLIQNVVEMHKDSKGGNSVIPINNYLIFTHFFQNQGNTYIIILMDDKENELNYPQMYLLVKKIKKQFPLNCSISDIIKTCDFISKTCKWSYIPAEIRYLIPILGDKFVGCHVHIAFK